MISGDSFSRVSVMHPHGKVDTPKPRDPKARMRARRESTFGSVHNLFPMDTQRTPLSRTNGESCLPLQVNHPRFSLFHMTSRDHPNCCPFAFGTSEIISALLVYQPTTWTAGIILIVVLSPMPCMTSSFNFILLDIIQIREEMASGGAMTIAGDQNRVLLQVSGRILYPSIQPKRGTCQHLILAYQFKQQLQQRFSPRLEHRYRRKLKRVASHHSSSSQQGQADDPGARQKNFLGH
ncbi:hypothetical protein CRG98_013285 [Punica granatum]|uniref:Uncharacterized protein n=1 Tax=Punica granatum TaxID=22663 RepID=A0A2I0KDS1_PUNGR|nr:hypothetical protein CRG98_013285 [Punica granatum]